MLIGNEVIKIVGQKKVYVNYLSTLSMMANNLVTGISEILIGALLNIHSKNATSKNDEELFLVLMLIGVVSSIVLLVRTKCYG